MLMVELKLKVSEAPDVRVVLPNRAENVAIVRQALTGIADAMRLDTGVLSDIKTAVSEACNNVVLHAYDGHEGPLEVYVCPTEDELDVVVRDEGLGIQPNPPEPDAGVQGVGLSLIQALTDHVEFRGASDEGTEVRMGFRAAGVVDSVAVQEAERQVAPPNGDMVLSVAAGALAAPVLGRVAAMLAARASFSVDRLADVVLVSDAIAAHAPASIVGRHIHVGVDTSVGALDVRVGPLEPGGGERLVNASALGGMPAVLSQLADDVDVVTVDDGEQLRLRITDAH
jgi:anti-sigma regulatory factor (Ser/Thr protein kinase)